MTDKPKRRHMWKTVEAGYQTCECGAFRSAVVYRPLKPWVIYLPDGTPKRWCDRKEG